MNVNEIKTYKAIILLNEIIENGRIFNTIFNGDDQILEPIFADLLYKGYLHIEGMNYCATKAGEDIFRVFMKRYFEYLKVYDVYSYVDTGKGEFAFEKFFDLTEDEWVIYKNQERFRDLRIAVAHFKKLNPFELVFMAFINENRFDTTVTGWQFDLISDDIWIEISNICQTAITVDRLAYTGVTGEEVIEDIVTKGSQLMITLLKKEFELEKEELAIQQASEPQYETVTTTTVYEDDYYDTELAYYECYYDPFWVSPIFYAPLFIW